MSQNCCIWSIIFIMIFLNINRSLILRSFLYIKFQIKFLLITTILAISWAEERMVEPPIRVDLKPPPSFSFATPASNVYTAWMTMPIDHFDPQNTDTYQMVCSKFVNKLNVMFFEANKWEVWYDVNYLHIYF